MTTFKSQNSEVLIIVLRTCVPTRRVTWASRVGVTNDKKKHVNNAYFHPKNIFFVSAAAGCLYERLKTIR